MEYINDLKKLPFGTILINTTRWNGSITIEQKIRSTIVLVLFDERYLGDFFDESGYEKDYSVGCDSKHVRDLEVAPDWIQKLFEIE